MRLKSWGFSLAVVVLSWYGLMLAFPRGPGAEVESVRQVRASLLELQELALAAQREGRTLAPRELDAWAAACAWPAEEHYPAVTDIRRTTAGTWLVRVPPRRSHARAPLWEQVAFLDFRPTPLPTHILASHDLTLLELYPDLDEASGTIRTVSHPPQDIEVESVLAQAAMAPTRP